MEDLVYFVDSVDTTGSTSRNEVASFEDAKKLARRLAIESGYRSIIRRKPRHSWSMHLANAQTGEIVKVWTGLSKRDAVRRWKLWNERETACVLVAWPEWLPNLEMSLSASA